LSFLANAHHIGLSIGSPFSDVIWKTGTPEKKHVSWLVENIGKSIFAECALTLPEAGGSAAGLLPILRFSQNWSPATATWVGPTCSR